MIHLCILLTFETILVKICVSQDELRLVYFTFLKCVSPL